jgi:hypothetical protein
MKENIKQCRACGGLRVLLKMQPRTPTTSQSGAAKTALQKNGQIWRSNLTLLCLKIVGFDAENRDIF